MSLALSSPTTTLRVLRGGTARCCDEALPARPVALRLRPDERPAWIALDLGVRDIAVLRARAREVGLGVDALVSLALEWMLLERDVPTLACRIQHAAEETRTCTHLPPTPALRGWVEHLEGCSEQPADTLPELLMPARLLARWRPDSAEVMAAVGAVPLATVLQLESRAATVGLTLTEWSYRAALLHIGLNV